MKKKKSSDALNLYLVSCEFNEDDEYEDFADALDEYPAWRHVFGEQWFVCSEDSAEDVYNNLLQHLFEGDFIFVCEVNGNYASYLPEETVEWMEENLEE